MLPLSRLQAVLDTLSGTLVLSVSYKHTEISPSISRDVEMYIAGGITGWLLRTIGSVHGLYVYPVRTAMYQASLHGRCLTLP